MMLSQDPCVIYGNFLKAITVSQHPNQLVSSQIYVVDRNLELLSKKVKGIQKTILLQL